MIIRIFAVLALVAACASQYSFAQAQEPLTASELRGRGQENWNIYQELVVQKGANSCASDIVDNGLRASLYYLKAEETALEKLEKLGGSSEFVRLADYCKAKDYLNDVVGMIGLCASNQKIKCDDCYASVDKMRDRFRETEKKYSLIYRYECSLKMAQPIPANHLSPGRSKTKALVPPEVIKFDTKADYVTQIKGLNPGRSGVDVFQKGSLDGG